MATYFDRSPHFRNLAVNINLHKKFDESQVTIKNPDMTSRDRFIKNLLTINIQTKTKRRHLLRFKTRYSNTRNNRTLVKFITFI